MKFYTLEETKDKILGKEGTPRRDSYESELKAFFVGEAVKKAREEKQLTQQELENLTGIHRAQISKIENGKSTSLTTMARLFRAMGICPRLDLGVWGHFSL